MTGRPPNGEVSEAPLDIATVNRLDRDELITRLRRCCASQTWAEHVAAARPHADLVALLTASDAIFPDLQAGDLQEAMGAHPRIGERVTGADTESEWSRQEQSNVAHVGADVEQALLDGNVEYEARFGHVFLICATGKSAQEMLDALRHRLTNDRHTEWSVIAEELRKITRLRLRRMITTMNTLSTHVLDAASGLPAPDMTVVLETRDGDGWSRIGRARTDDDGRIAALAPDGLLPAVYRLTFATGPYFTAKGQPAFFPEVSVVFEVTDTDRHHHVPLLLSPFAYSTYRGS